LFLMLSGVIDFGRAFYFCDIAANTARAGTMWASLSSANAGNTAGMEAAARSEAPELPASALTVTPSFFCQNTAGSVVDCAANPNAEEYVRVVTQINYNLMIPWPGLANPLRLGGISVMRVQ